MTKIQENRKENKNLTGRNVFINKNNGERFFTINEIEEENAYRLIVETKDYDSAYFCENYEILMRKIMSFDEKTKLTVVCLRGRHNEHRR